jgi:aspartate kinase
MKVFKFGGASVKDAAAVRNVAEIMKSFASEQLVVVISAMGKTTNALEAIVNAYFYQKGNPHELLEGVKKYHFDIMKELFIATTEQIYVDVNNFFVEIEWVLEEKPARNYNFIYDQVVSIGELISTRIVSAFLTDSAIPNQWLDVRNCIFTDNTYREGKVDWQLSSVMIREQTTEVFNLQKIIVTQGFIGSTSENYTTTLGREGSDYTAAIFAHALDAEAVMIWKDVPGMLNADPKFFKEAQMLESLSSHDAIELSYYGASVIHPKTIKPLENKNIPLYVKSFLKPDAKGTVINRDIQTKPKVPSFIFKTDQVLISIAAKDFSFIAEDNLALIFGLFARAGIKINLMQNSAISFSVCVDNDEFKIPSLLDDLHKEFKVLYNDNLELFTIRNYFQSTIDMLSAEKEILVEQRSRTTVQLVMRGKENTK